VSDLSTPALESKGFLRSLFDFSFSSFIARRVVRVLYILITITYSLGALGAFIALLARHTPADIVLAVVAVPLGYILYLTFARITLEVLMVIFGIGEDLREIRDRGAGSPTPS